MNQGGLFAVIINAIKARVMPIVNKLRMYTSISFLRTKVLVKVREFFIKLLDVKPKHKKDYYTVGNWMISKKLAFAAVVILGALSLLYIFAVRKPFGNFGSADGIKTYKYTSMALRLQTGKVRITGRGGYLAYEGNVEKGYTKGYGTLWDKQGSTVYIGNFEKSKYEGNGTLYYTGEIVHYTGDFHENIFEGTGKLYRESSTLWYQGEFVAGRKEGEGNLYDNGGTKVFEGIFAADEIAYSQLVGKTTADMAQQYIGRRKVFTGTDEMAVYLSDIDAVYSIPTENKELGDSSTIDAIYVLHDHINFGGNICTNIAQVRDIMGTPTYQGDSFATYPEICGIYEMSKNRKIYSGTPEISFTQELDDLITVDSYTLSYPVYLYTFERDGLLYSFLTRDEAGTGFDMYFISVMSGE